MKLLCTLLLFLLFSNGFAQEDHSPYLLVSTKDAIIPLKSSKTEVHITGTIAHVRVSQIYQNKGPQPIEAKYVFPLSIRAAVHKMDMIIGARTLSAKIVEREEAQKMYEIALNEGKRAAKLDQDRPNLFQMNVGNVMPDDDITIDIYYTELLVPENGEYQFVAPAVVGPRFTGESKVKAESFNIPYTAKGIADTFDFDMMVTLNSGMRIQHIGSSSHSVEVHYPDANTAEVILCKNNENPSNRDFILNYILRGNKIQSGLLLYEHSDENFFAYQMEPTKNIAFKDIPAREYLFIVDVSGSMNGYPLEVSKELMRNLLFDLRPTDVFNVQLFASSSTVFSPIPIEVNGQNIEAAIRFLSEGQGSGGTELLDALKDAYRIPRKNYGSARSMVVISDGYISVEKEAFELIKNNLDQANVFTFGIGSSVNRYLIEGMAKVSQSEAFVATSKSEARIVAKKFKEYIATPILTQIKIESKGFEIYDLAPSSIPDVFASRPIVVYGKYRGEAAGTIVVTGYHGNKKFYQEYKVSQGRLAKANKALRYVWARNKIAELDDYQKLFDVAVKDSVIALGMHYNLATAYTSFVAVDEGVANKNGSLKTIKQPLPMPQHVNNFAVGADAKMIGRTNFRKSFTVVLDESISKAEKRNITMAFKGIYSKLANIYLAKYNSVRIKFNTKGEIITIEIMEIGKWMFSDEITREFAKFTSKRLILDGKMVRDLNNELILILER